MEAKLDELEDIDFDDLEELKDEYDNDFDSLNVIPTSRKDEDEYLDGTPVNSADLTSEDEYEYIEETDGFISSTGDLVLMNTSESEDGFESIYVDVTNIGVSTRIRISQNVDDLVRSIKSTGLLEPLIVMPTITPGKYVLVHGYRRLLACVRAGKRRIPCTVNNKISTPELPILEAMYNHRKNYTIKEIVEYINYLEKEKGIMSASMIEYLLQLNSGDYTKLKDILNDNDDDIVSKLYDGIFTIEAAFRKLEQRRKKESAEEKDLKKAEQVYEDEKKSGADKLAGSGEDVNDGEVLTDEELKEIAITVDDLNDSNESIDELVADSKNMKGFEPNKQDPGNRERLDPVLRKSVLARDDNTCKICELISGQEYTEVLDVHHINEVYLGGSDDIDNLLTACVVCHKLVHLYARGELHIRKESDMTEQEKMKFRRVVKLGNVIRKGMELKGIKKDQLKKLDKAETIGRTLKGSSAQIAG